MDYKLYDKTTNLLLRAGVPASVIGFDALRQAILLVVEDPGILRQVTKRLYPAAAEKIGTTSPRAERAIRHAIETAWNRGDPDDLNRIFGAVSPDKGKPTNSEFIAAAAELLRRQTREAG